MIDQLLATLEHRLKRDNELRFDLEQSRILLDLLHELSALQYAIKDLAGTLGEGEREGA